LLAQAGIASRRSSEDLIAQGRVKVDGRPVTQPGTRVDPKLARVEVDGQLVLAQEPTYIVMNKPDEVVSSAEASKDPRGRSTVVSLLSSLRTRVVPVGRLDYHTRGVLLLTNDGALHAALLHPRRAVPKTYHVKFQGKLGEDELAQLHAGVRLEDGTRTRPSLEVELVKATTTNTWVQLTISQGLNRQIRRMGDAIGHSVLKLIRVAFAGITGDGLREGQWRHLKPEEVAGLYTLAGMKAPVRDQAIPDASPRGVAVMRTPTAKAETSEQGVTATRPEGRRGVRGRGRSEERTRPARGEDRSEARGEARAPTRSETRPEARSKAVSEARPATRSAARSETRSQPKPARPDRAKARPAAPAKAKTEGRPERPGRRASATGPAKAGRSSRVASRKR
jgi:23S rRNA pseudouridine2605 synthase